MIPIRKILYRINQMYLLILLSNAELEKLINQGLYNEALDFVSKIDNIDSKLKLLKVEIFRELGEYQHAIELVQSILSDKSTEENIRAGALVELAYLNYRLENFDEVSKLLIQSDLIIENIGLENYFPLKFKYHCVQGNNYWKLSKLEFALRSYKESLRLAENTQNDIFRAQALNAIGNINQQMGKFNEAISFYLRCISISEKIDARKYLVYSYGNLGETYRLLYEFDLAKEYLELALKLYQEMSNKVIIAVIQGNLAVIDYKLNEIDSAIKGLNDVINIFEKYNNFTYASEYSFHLIMIYLNQKKADLALEEYRRISKFTEKQPTEINNLRLRLSNALIKKHKNQLIDKAEAQKELIELANSETIYFEFNVLSLIHLCDLYLEEYQIYNQPEVLDKAITITNRIYNLAILENSFSLNIEALLLKAKLLLIQGEISLVDNALKKAEVEIKRRRIPSLESKILEEQTNLVRQIKQWVDLSSKSEPLRKRIDEQELNSYIEKIIKRHF